MREKRLTLGELRNYVCGVDKVKILENCNEEPKTVYIGLWKDLSASLRKRTVGTIFVSYNEPHELSVFVWQE